MVGRLGVGIPTPLGRPSGCAGLLPDTHQGGVDLTLLGCWAGWIDRWVFGGDLTEGLSYVPLTEDYRLLSYAQGLGADTLHIRLTRSHRIAIG